MNNLDRTARLFRRHRGQWLSALEIARVGGFLSWRTRASECRTLLGMAIENRQERSGGNARSFYRYVGRQKAS